MDDKLRKMAIHDIEETIEESVRKKRTSTTQATYILGKLYVYTTEKIITREDENRLYKLLEKNFVFTLKDYDNLIL